MSIRRMESEIVDVLPVNYVLASVFDKTELDSLVRGLLDANPDVVFVSTGGTGGKIKEILGEEHEKNYVSVDVLTGTPEMEGGLVKTLTPGIHARLLGERNNPKHQAYLEMITPSKGLSADYMKLYGMEGTPNQIPKVGFFDLLVNTLYPFEEKAGEFPDKSNFEDCRGNIDIGGPAMIRATAKNFPNIAVVTGIDQYARILREVKETGGISFNTRADLSVQAFETTAQYDKAISEFFFRTIQVDAKKAVRTCYDFRGGE